MPEEIFVIVIVSILAGSFISIVRTILNYKRAKYQRPEAPEQASLTTSELQRLMRAAVEDATQPLAAKIDALEHRLEARPAPPALEEGRRSDAARRIDA